MNITTLNLIKLVKENDLTNFDRLINSPDFNLNKKQKKNLLSYIVTYKHKHDNAVDFLNSVYNNGNFNFSDLSIFALALTHGSRPEIVKSIYNHHKEIIDRSLVLYSEQPFSISSFKLDDEHPITSLTVNKKDYITVKLSFSNLFYYWQHEHSSGIFATNLYHNPDIMAELTKYLNDKTDFINFLTNPNLEKINLETIKNAHNTLIHKGIITKDSIFLEGALNPKFNKHYDEFLKYAVGLFIQDKKDFSLIHLRPLWENYIHLYNSSSLNMRHYEQQTNAIHCLLGKESPVYKEDDMAGLTFFKILKKHTYVLLKSIYDHKNGLSNEIVQQPKLSKNYSSDYLKGQPTKETKKFILDSFSLILNNYSKAKEDQIFNDPQEFAKYTSWFDYYGMKELSTLFEKHLITNYNAKNNSNTENSMKQTKRI